MLSHMGVRFTCVVLVSLVASCLLPDAHAFDFNVTLNVRTGTYNSSLATFTDTPNDLFIAKTVLAPCAAVVAHVHNAAETVYLISGKLDVGYADTTSKLVSEVLRVGQGFTFPKGLIHYQHNPYCKQAVFIATFPAAVPGSQFAARDISTFPTDYLLAQYNGTVPQPFKTRFFLDQKCAKRCKV